ncbi:translation initiation factor 2D [Trypanosoma grayi]|uniref:translation initiation factor 2D n=1 Tax=Trypanosoma grayi TaxID=71804 RepID=UPI0004F420FD|nr:translation initiation factor 2D [Trypanosoma grayi]KEG12169.1 translation initiation factor 2D [Trypanosoma grayi]
MFHKKHSIKEVSAVGKKEAKKLREGVVGLLENEHSECVESFWKKNDTLTRITWDFSTGGSAAFYVVNEVPLAISTCLPDDAHGANSKGEMILAPTLFFFLMVRNYYKGEDVDIATLYGPSVWCRGPTSQFILSGAHLMIPGVVNVGLRDEKPLRTGQLVFVYSLGTVWPYAIGLSTDELVNGSERGRAVYVLHSYRDSLWDSYYTLYNAKCGSLCSSLPSMFRSTDVAEGEIQKINLLCDDSMGEELEKKEPIEDFETPEEGTSHTENDILKSVMEDLAEEDGVLDFALCEAVKGLSQSMLPIPLTEFSPLLLSNYPRVLGADMHIDFKRTKYKKLLTYLFSRADVVSVSEEKKGNHSLTRINKTSELLRQHRRKFADFLCQVHEPAKEEEMLEAEQQVFRESGKGVFKRRIVSIETLFSPRNGEPLELKRILCTGIFPGHPGGNAQEENVAQCVAAGFIDDDDTFLDELYSRKHLCDNLRSYVQSRGLFQLGVKSEGAPFVRLKEALSVLVKNSVELLRITTIEDTVFQNMFTPVHQITMETNQILNGASASKSVITRAIKKGKLPKVLMHTEKRVGNKIVTVVRGLDTYGFDLISLVSEWKHRFSTFCTIHDPSKEMQRVKQGTKISLEVQLGGDWLSKLKVVLEKDMGLPQYLIDIHGK